MKDGLTKDANGTKFWYKNGKLHREDGPAVETSSGYKAWYLNGQHHRENGPAVEFSNGLKFWYINGVELTEEAFNQQTKISCEGKVVEITEKKFKKRIKPIEKPKKLSRFQAILMEE